MRRILIVEDEVLIGMVLEDIIETLGRTVVGNAATLDEAIAHIASLGAGGFDLAVLDVNLGAAPVFPVADAIAALGKPIIFTTGSHPDSLPPRFSRCAVLEKPYALAAVEAAFEQVSATV